jgi:flagellar motor component MotA
MKIYLTLILALASLPSHAYIGPGMGAGAIIATLGVLGAIFLAIFGVLYYPIKRILKKRKSAMKKNDES